MMKLLLLTFLTTLLLPASSFSQEYSYAHYDIGEGLAGSTVYCITQDKDGFIWVGTETGVSRFDGTHFLNFTTADGLPDIEVLNMFGDSKGRVWMAPFRKSVCYYYKGRIYNQDNDSLLRKANFRNNIENFAEDKEGNILIQERNVLHLFRQDGEVSEYDSINGKAISGCAAICRSASGHFLVQEGESIYELAGDRFIWIRAVKLSIFQSSYVALSARSMVSRRTEFEWGMVSFMTGKTTNFPFASRHYRHNSFTIIDDSLVYLNETTGSTQYNVNTGESKQFLPGMAVSRVFRDDGGNTWLTTLGQGIFRLNSNELKSIVLLSPLSGKCAVYSIGKWGDELFLGTNSNSAFRFQLPGFSKRLSSVTRFIAKARVVFIDQMENGDMLLATDNDLLRFSHDLGTFIRLFDINSRFVFPKNDRELLIAGVGGLFLFDRKGFRITDTIWHERATAVYYRNDSTYVGTLNGLYLISKDRSVINMGSSVPFLRKRISAITGSPDGTLWIASFDDAGIMGYKNGQVIATLGKKQGLTSDICRTLYMNKNSLWVGTDKGLNKVELGKPGYPVTRYTSNEGLGSDIVNTVYVDSPTVYVGTAAGLSFFDEGKTSITADCRLMWLGLINSGHDRIADTAGLRLTYTDNNIRFEYVGISYKSAGNIQYKYRLLGLDSAWKDTKETYLEYPTLPSGKYELQVEATNRFDVKSRLMSLHFVVTTPFWRTTWFYALIILAFLSLTWLFVNFRIKRIRERQEEKERLSKKVVDMEQMALRAQMNPHFIFNCMTSIQQYIFDKDIFEANKYITGFARLIRATLQNSTQAFISLDEELSFLSDYLSLEKLRFKEKMDFSFEVDESINGKEIFIPPMLIQPFVENSMRHGLRHKTEGKGHILVRVRQAEGKLEFTIEDNGIGRAKAAQFKTGEHIEYQSKGMAMTADRIRIINSVYDDGIRLEVTDLKNEQGQAIGTRVVILF